ncbi:MAG: sulfite exporter TauE/SafE family protein [Propionibacteriaceae bacterium]|jgi:uncharacterized membrane protein YfcA|nr:sulfite exporter TauE/SafE family protein [Propionibacteriaceae bacterium]
MTDFAHVWSDLPWWGWTLAVVAALLFGFSKTAIGNLALAGVVILAALTPAKDSTGAALLLLLVGDLVASWVYRKSVDWRLLGRLVVPVVAGLALGAWFLSLVSDLVLKRTIGVVLLVLLLLGRWADRLAARTGSIAYGYGALAGFTTMTANAGGPAMSLYLLAARFDKLRFLGTNAWFFFAVNAAKVPVSVGLGIIRPEVCAFAAALAPAVLVGTWLGRVAVKRMDQKLFERLVTLFVALSALYLVFG